MGQLARRFTSPLVGRSTPAMVTVREVSRCSMPSASGRLSTSTTAVACSGPKLTKSNVFLHFGVAAALALCAINAGGGPAVAAPSACRIGGPAQSTGDAHFDVAVAQAHAGCLLESWENLKRADS